MIKVLYKLFLAAMIALFVGFGISVFYTAPKAPDWPVELSQTGKEMTTEEKVINAKFNQEQKEYQASFTKYSRNVSAIAIGISIFLLVVSLTVLLRVDIMGDGVLLGGLFTLFYGIIRSFMSNDSKFQFIAVTVGLIAAITLGYIKFIRPSRKNS